MSQTAKESDKLFLIRPSSDAFLAVGVLKVLRDRGYLNQGIDVSWEIIEDETGLRRRDVEEMAEFYLDMKPLTLIGFALGRTFQGGKAISLISTIPSVIGMKGDSSIPIRLTG